MTFILNLPLVCLDSLETTLNWTWCSCVFWGDFQCNQIHVYFISITPLHAAPPLLHIHTCTHARTRHARTHARTHTHTHTHTHSFQVFILIFSVCWTKHGLRRIVLLYCLLLPTPYSPHLLGFGLSRDLPLQRPPSATATNTPMKQEPVWPSRNA